MIPFSARPPKSTADYLAVAVCPFLIMAMVGSLVFMLLEASYSGPWLGGMRWVLFWFTLAIVLVARIAIERNRYIAFSYGALLATATLMTMMVHFGFILPACLLLGIVWWAADRIVRDCTLIDEDIDSSGVGLMASSKVDALGATKTTPVKLVLYNPVTPIPARKKKIAKTKPRRAVREQKVHAPGVWVLYFALAAVPLFGMCEMFLPIAEPDSRRFGFRLLAVYLISALLLLLLTSFLGLRRYLRQRGLRMSTQIAFGWIRAGIILAVLIVGMSALLPRPATPYSLDRWVTQSFEDGSGDAGENGGTKDTQQSKPGGDTPGNNKKDGPAGKQTGGQQPTPGDPMKSHLRLPNWADWISRLMLLVVAAALLWRFWPEFLSAWRAFWEGLAARRRNKEQSRSNLPGLKRSKEITRQNYPNPFASGAAAAMSPEELVRYSFQAVRHWAAGRGTAPESHETPVEFAERLVQREPVLQRELFLLSRYYSHLAYGAMTPPPECIATLQKIWTIMTFDRRPELHADPLRNAAG